MYGYVGRVLIGHSYFLKYDAKQTRKMKPYPPLSTLITASVLRDSGFEVSLFDAMLSDGEAEFEELVRRLRPPIVGILEDNFNFLTKMCTTRMREACLEMIRMAKAGGSRVCVNGSDAADHAELYLEAGADAVIVGETELTFRQLAEAWSREESPDLSTIPGLILRRVSGRHGPSLAVLQSGAALGGDLLRTATRPFVEDLDDLPLPAWDLVDVGRYREAWTKAHGRFSWNLITTRGCPFKCNWCAKPLYGTRYAQRSPASVAEELRLLKASVAPDHAWFADDIFGLTARWIESFADEVAQRDARIPFHMQSRVDLMRPPAVAALAAAGAEEVWLGVESGAQSILDRMDKGTTLEEIRSATRMLREHGIRAAWFLQLGYTGETWEDILLTRDLVRDERPDDIGVSVSYPLPGTVFHDRVKEHLAGQTNWRESDDLLMMFKGTYTSPFYKKIRDLLHDEALVVQLPDGPEAGERRLALDEAWREAERTEAEFRAVAVS